MTVKIYEILKSDLSIVTSKVVNMANTVGMTISHYACSVKSAQASIPYTIEGVDKHVPYVEDADFCIVARTRIDLTATGVNEQIIKDVGSDTGKYKYADSVPTTPLDLPPGFQEVYKNK